MKRSNLKDKRFISLLRCSTRGQADTSIVDQRRVLDAFARDHGLVFVDEIVLGGISGSLPGARDDIPQLIDRKENANDFEILLVQDSSRLTRAGIKHVHHLEWILNAAGIKIVYATGQNAEGWVGELETSFNAGVDQAHARSISFGTARGSMSSILNGRAAYCRKPPYAIDRLYVSPDGTPLHIIRNLSNGRQVQLHPHTLAIIQEFKSNEESGIPNHYGKQKQERVVLIPGEERCVETLRLIYRRYYIDNIGSFRIATELNTNGIPSPRGCKWNTHTILNILRNPIYLGRGIANRFSSAVYHMRADDCPVALEVDPSELSNRKRPVCRIRPKSDWRYQDHVQLAELIEPDVRDIAVARQQVYLDAQADGHIPKPNRDRHRNSSFFLKGILHSKQGGEPMSGVTTGRKGSKYRYYRVNRAFDVPDNDTVMRKVVPAGPLEQAVLEIVKQTLLALPDLRERIDRQIHAELKAASKDNDKHDQLTKEREAIRNKLNFIVDRFDSDMQNLVDEEITALKAQLSSINDRIVRCEAATPMSDKAVDDLVEKTVVAVHNLARTLDHAPPEILRQLLQIVIHRLVVNLETRDVELEIRLPGNLASEELSMCLVKGFVCKTYNQTHHENSFICIKKRLFWRNRVYAFVSHTGEFAA